VTQKQAFAQCVQLAPDFRLGLAFPVLGRSLVWYGTPRATGVPLTAGVQFPTDNPVDPLLDFLLQQALVTLTQAV
jgi:hypothetical protein